MQTDNFLLGKNPRPLTNGQSSIGFRPLGLDSMEIDSRDLTYGGNQNITIMAGTSYGKTRSGVIPNLLNHPGSALVLDSKKELYDVTASARRAMGQQVVCLDPALLTGATDSLNPFDMFLLAIASVELEGQTFTQLLMEGQQSAKDPFWHISAGAIITGLIVYMVTCLPPEQQNLTKLRELLHADDTVYTLATVLDKYGKNLNRVAYEEIAAFLQMPDQNTRPSVLATAQSFLKTFVSPGVTSSTSSTSFSLADWTAGKPITIYIIIPPYRFDALKGLFKVWITTLAMACMARTTLPALPTLFMLDEAAMLGPFDYLKQLHSIGRGYGIRLATCWQSLAQLQANYPNNGWMEILDNCGVLQCFGSSSYLHATDMARLMGVSPSVFLDLAKDEQIISLEGKTMIAKKLDYLTDARFKGQFSANPFYVNQGLAKQ